MIKNDFQKILSRRKKLLKRKEDKIDDLKEIIDSMLMNPQETILFLCEATREEFALALEGITAFVYKYPQKNIVDICKEKVMQYHNLQKYCRIDIAQIIKEIEDYVRISSEKERTLKEEFCAILEARECGREQDIDLYTLAHGYDHETMRQLLCRNYEETIAFLRAANKEEIATAVEILDNLVLLFKSKEIIEIFQAKGVEFPDVDDICEFDYFECIEEAESCLEELKSKELCDEKI